jgi:excisionase family DNA binding protein
MAVERRATPTLPQSGGRRWQDRQFLTVGAIAAKIGVREDTVRKWIRAGSLKAYRFGSDLRIDLADAEAYVERSATA